MVTVTTSAERAGTSATIHVRVSGSPMAAPTGSITISEPGIIPATQVALTAVAEGVSQADVTLTNVTPGVHTLVAVYSGDTYFNALTQNARLLAAHRRAAGR